MTHNNTSCNTYYPLHHLPNMCKDIIQTPSLIIYTDGSKNKTRKGFAFGDVLDSATSLYKSFKNSCHSVISAITLTHVFIFRDHEKHTRDAASSFVCISKCIKFRNSQITETHICELRAHLNKTTRTKKIYWMKYPRGIEISKLLEFH